MFRPVQNPYVDPSQHSGVPREAVERLIEERDALAQDRQTLIAEVQRLRHALVAAQTAPRLQVVAPEVLQPTVTDESGPREQELLDDIATLKRNTMSRIDQAVLNERARLLSVVADAYDDVARAMGPPPSDAFPGLTTILRAFDDRLSSLGVSRVGSVGQRFDPTQFEAVALDETQPDGEVVAVVSTGLREDTGRLLRSAKVVVGGRSARY